MPNFKEWQIELVWLLDLVEERMDLMFRAITLRGLLLLFVLGASCVTSQNVTGEYHWISNATGPDAFKINLLDDHSYYFVGWSDILGNDSLTGEWEVQGKRLTLLPNDPSQERFIKHFEGKNDSLTHTVVKVLDDLDGSSLVGADVYINNEAESHIIGIDGTIRIEEDIRISKVWINYANVIDSVQIKDRTANEITILINFQGREIEFLSMNGEWLVRGRKLIPIINGRLDNEGAFVKTD